MHRIAYIQSWIRRRILSVLLLAVLPLLVLSFYWFYRSPKWASLSLWNTAAPGLVREFSGWDSIVPSTSLQYVPCFDGFQCARLEVPLDWNSSVKGYVNHPTVALAIAKRPAVVPVTDPRYGGVVLFNPGGPGESGIGLILDLGAMLQTIVSGPSLLDAPENSKYFDVLSWDPRGINNTTPNHGCIRDEQARNVWQAQDQALGTNFNDTNVFDQLWSRNGLLGNVCALPTGINAAGNNGHLGRFFGTASVVRDMVEIIEQHGKWREAEAQRLVFGDGGTALESAKLSLTRHDHEALERTAWKPGEEQLQYWGFSYGTALGQYFASMQPHRVRRVVLDGVVDMDDYLAGDWRKNLQDTDKITAAFASQCFDAGSQKCLVFDDSGPEQILSNLYSALDTLHSDPLLGFDTNTSPFVITDSMITSKIFDHLYKPVSGFPKVAEILHHVSLRNASYFEYLLSPKPICKVPQTPVKDHSTAILAVLCTDGLPHDIETKEEFRYYVSQLRDQSSLFANTWALIRLPCRGYSIRAKWRYGGPFGGITAHPILFASQRLDPVTPLRNMYAERKRWPGSGILNAGGIGHCTPSAKSVCAMKAVRQYFQTGELPREDLDCRRDRNLFERINITEAGDEYGAKDRELVKATMELGDSW